MHITSNKMPYHVFCKRLIFAHILSSIRLLFEVILHERSEAVKGLVVFGMIMIQCCLTQKSFVFPSTQSRHFAVWFLYVFRDNYFLKNICYLMHVPLISYSAQN